MDWPVAAGDIFLATALTIVLLSPIAGAAGGWQRVSRVPRGAVALGLVVTFGLLFISWRQLPGGRLAALSGHAALLVAAFALTELGRTTRALVRDPLAAGLIGWLIAMAVTLGPFALGPLMGDLPLGAYNWMLLANPLVTVATASGIDFLHLDLIYRSSPLAHRGVVLPAWTTASVVYAFLGGALFGVSRLRRRSA